MKTIEVKAVEGRVARTAPDGAFIPSDRYVPVRKTRYIERLLDVHGDIQQKPAEIKKPDPEPDMKSVGKSADKRNEKKGE